MEDYAIIILAAGSSSRMGQSKQLLQINGKTLLRHTIDEAQKLLPRSVYVVTGANAEELKSELNHCDLHICYNPNWQEGMASSIQAGLKAAQATNPAMKGCLLSVCDQPHLSAEVLARLISLHKEDPALIIASVYQGTTGVPVLFGLNHFAELMKLKGQDGAKKLLKKQQQYVVTVPFPGGEIDIDTPHDYQRFTAIQPR